MLPLQRIFCPIDFSDHSFQALENAGALASLFGAELWVLHVSEPMATSSYSASGYLEKLPAYEKAVNEYVQLRLEAVLGNYHFPNVTLRTLSRIGDPAHEILTAAHEEGADLLVFSTHGATGWRRSGIGSVAEKLLRLAPCPVLLLQVQGAPEVDPHQETVLRFRKLLGPSDCGEPSISPSGLTKVRAQAVRDLDFVLPPRRTLTV